MFCNAKKVYIVGQKFQDPGLCHHSAPSPSVQNDQTLGRFCEPLYFSSCNYKCTCASGPLLHTACPSSLQGGVPGPHPTSRVELKLEFQV